jgi:recombination protein RecT
MANDKIQTQAQGAVTKGRPVQTLATYLEGMRDTFAKLLPAQVSPERLVKVALNCVSRTPALAKCDMLSVVQCVATCAELGLLPGGALGGAYLVPYGQTCTLVIGYRGMVDLMRRSGELAAIDARVVHERDEFVWREGLVRELVHVPCLDVDPGPMRLVYCLLRFRDGSTQVEVMSRGQVDAIRARSRAANSGPWVTDYEEMAKKTVIRRAAKLAPMSSELATALEAEDDDAVEGEVVRQPPRQARGTEELARQLAERAVASEEVPAEPPAVEAAPPPSPPASRRLLRVEEPERAP